MDKPTHIIIDFSASKIFTHHWKSIETFCNLYTRESSEFQVFIPKYADKSLLEDLWPVRRTLISTDFGPTLREIPSLKIANEIVKKYLHKFPSRSRKVLRQILLRLYTRRIRKQIISSCRKHEKVVVLFPSVEPLSVFTFLKLRSKKIPNLEWRLRLIGSQERGLLSGGNETELLQTSMQVYPYGVQIGYETFPYQKYLQSRGFPNSNLYWSPFPSQEMKLTQNTEDFFRIGFLGSAKERKGFELIPTILEAIAKEFSNFEFIVQEAAYPWREYSQAFEKLTDNPQVTLLPGELSDTQLTEYIASCNLIVLPYDPDSYALAASAILYHAADSHIPVMCPKGVGFAEEIEKFNVGIVYENLSAFSEFQVTLERLLKIPQSNFIHYNEARDINNKSFLSI